MASPILHTTVGTSCSQAEFEAVVHNFSIEHHVADDTLTTGETGSIHTNLGEDGAMTLTLPQDAVAGDFFHFAVMYAGELRVDPGLAGQFILTEQSKLMISILQLMTKGNL